MQYHPDITANLLRASDPLLPSVADNEKALMDAITGAISWVQSENDMCLMKAKRTSCAPMHCAPRNAWYDNTCKEARRRVRDAETHFGINSAQAATASHNYRNTTRHAKTAWDTKHMHDLHAALYSDSKQFWNAYGGSKRKSPLTDIDAWTKYFTELFAATNHEMGGNADDVRRLFPDADAARTDLAAWLNSEFTEDEITVVMEQDIKRGKSPGVDGLPAEYFRYAYVNMPDRTRLYMLSKPLTCIFNRVLKEGYPSHWATSALVPVPKPKGNIQDRDDHRGIAVGSAISKLFAICMLHRMDTWAEDNHYRASGQSGFRTKRGTLDATFTLNHIIDKHASTSPVYVAFIDFKKAYDWVDRQLLWRCLESLGMHGECLSTLKCMYEKVRLQVRLNGALGSAFDSETGVKQGDPLSPLLFGLFIDKIESFLRDKYPTAGVLLLNKIVQVLLYADDLALMTTSADDMQHLLDGLSDFCKASGMQVSIKKSEIVVFNSHLCSAGDLQIAHNLLYNGIPLAVKKSFIYLGIILSDDPPATRMQNAFNAALRKARYAAHLMFRRCYTMGLHNVSIQCHLFDSLVKPILNYGCELWAPLVMTARNITTDHDTERWHRSVLRQSLGVCSSTTTAVIMDELGRQPMCMAWLKLVLKFWNKIVLRDEGDLARMAMQESLTLQIAGSWAVCLKTALSNLGCTVQLNSLDPIDVDICVAEAYAKWHGSGACDEPNQVRCIPDNQRLDFKYTKYKKWFAPVAGHTTKKSFTYHLYRRDQVQAVAQFRMSAHWLNCERMRVAADGRNLPRSCRICPCCKYQVREDEMHILECTHYNDMRLRYCSLFRSKHGVTDCTPLSGPRL
jgi:hypothetical protein